MFTSISTQHLFTHPLAYPAHSLRERIPPGRIYFPVKEGYPFLGPSSPVREDFRNVVKKTTQCWTNKVYAHRGRRRGDFRIPRGKSYKRRCDRYTMTHRLRPASPLALQTLAAEILRNCWSSSGPSPDISGFRIHCSTATIINVHQNRNWHVLLLLAVPKHPLTLK